VTRELLSPRAVAARDLFDPAEVSALIAAHEASRVDGTDRLLALLNLEVWCRIFLDGQAPADLATQLKGLAGRSQPARATA
jgi:asparagine synthase (glutamine-hydrolysing)